MKISALYLFKKAQEILSGFRNLIFKTYYTERIASYRLSVCQRCPFMDRKGSSCWVPGTQPCCSKCGCSLQVKVRSMQSECPEKKWPATEDRDSNNNNMILGI